jgi:hypothetical protein
MSPFHFMPCALDTVKPCLPPSFNLARSDASLALAVRRQWSDPCSSAFANLVYTLSMFVTMLRSSTGSCTLRARSKVVVGSQCAFVHNAGFAASTCQKQHQDSTYGIAVVALHDSKSQEELMFLGQWCVVAVCRDLRNVNPPSLV